MHTSRAARLRAGLRSVRPILDSLERRQHLNAAYHALLAGPLTQNWDVASLITTATGWSNVPSIEGFSGAALSGSDPRTILGSDTPGALQINADQTNPSTYATGGPAEFALATAIPATTPNTGLNTVALQGSGASDVPYLKLYLNTSGTTNVRVRYDLIDIDGGTPGAASTQPFALQYRVGNSGNFTNLDGGYVANAADQTTGATGLRNAIDVTLPVAANNQPIVEVRIMTVDAGGSDQFVAVDNIDVSAIPIGPTPGEFSFSQATYSVNESVGNAVFTVRRANGSTGAVSVAYATSNGTAVAPGDYGSTSGVLNFADGVDSLTFTVPIVDDFDIESAETFTITLSNPTGGATLSTPSTATVTINDDDLAGEIGFNPATYQVIENAGTVALTVERAFGTAGAVSVNWTAIAGTASSPGDYTTTSGVVNFANGETSRTILITLVNDALPEANEQFSVTLSDPTGGASLGAASMATITIFDDDVPVPTGLLLNEIDINPPNADLPYQYVELRGTPNFVLSNVWLLEVEGDVAQNPGRINSIVPLDGAQIGSNGLLLIRSPNGFAPESPATGLFDTTLFDVGGIDFQPGSSSFVLYYDFAGLSVAVGTDLDPTNSGTLTLPMTGTALDVVGVLDGSNNDKAYGAVLGPIGTNASPDAPDGISRFFNNNTAKSADAWFWGNLVGASSDSKTYTTVTSQLSPNFPVGGILTPGGAMTGVVSAIFDYAGTSQSLVVTFSEDVAASIATGDFELLNQTTGNTPVTLTVLSISPDGTTVRLGFTGTTGIRPTLLADGDYLFRVKAGEVGDGTSVLPIDYTTAVFFKNGDLNHDRTVGFDDLLIIAQRYGTQSGATFATGDANYDGKVDFDDLLIIAQQYGTTLILVPPVIKAPASTSRASVAKSVIA